MRSLLILLILATLSRAGDLPWIGVIWKDVDKVDQEKIGLSEQVGFQVRKVIQDGPLDLASGRRGDIWWKIDDQILVSKCQLLVLLRAKKPGDEIQVAYYREEKLQELRLTLGTRPGDKIYSIAHGPQTDIASRTLLTRREEVARLSSKGHDFSLQRDGETMRFEVRTGQEILLNDSFPEKDVQKHVPAKWLDSYLVMKLTLDRPAPELDSQRKKRVRYVPRNQGSKE